MHAFKIAVPESIEDGDYRVSAIVRVRNGRKVGDIKAPDFVSVDFASSSGKQVKSIMWSCVFGDKQVDVEAPYDSAFAARAKAATIFGTSPTAIVARPKDLWDVSGLQAPTT